MSDRKCFIVCFLIIINSDLMIVKFCLGLEYSNFGFSGGGGGSMPNDFSIPPPSFQNSQSNQGNWAPQSQMNEGNNSGTLLCFFLNT